MPESHSETTSEYRAWKIRADVVEISPPAVLRVPGRQAPLTGGHVQVVETAPWLSRSEQEGLLQALETGWAIIEDEWAGTKRFEGGDFNHVGNAVRLLRKRLARP